MTGDPDPSPTLALPGLVSHIHELTGGRPDSPSAREIRDAAEILYAASLLKEEGRSVRARVILAPPDAFPASGGPPEGAHAVRFSTTHPLTPNEIKRLSPAASFFHSVVAVWPEKGRGFRIWGLLNTGPRWLNMVAGGRKSSGEEIELPVIHVRDPGWLLFYQGYQLLAEWRGNEFHGPRIDVFQSRLLKDRFSGFRMRMVQEYGYECLPQSLELPAYADLSHLWPCNS